MVKFYVMRNKTQLGLVFCVPLFCFSFFWCRGKSPILQPVKAGCAVGGRRGCQSRGLAGLKGEISCQCCNVSLLACDVHCSLV